MLGSNLCPHRFVTEFSHVFRLGVGAICALEVCNAAYRQGRFGCPRNKRVGMRKFSQHNFHLTVTFACVDILAFCSAGCVDVLGSNICPHSFVCKRSNVFFLEVVAFFALQLRNAACRQGRLRLPRVKLVVVPEGLTVGKRFAVVILGRFAAYATVVVHSRLKAGCFRLEILGVDNFLVERVFVAQFCHVNGNFAVNRRVVRLACRSVRRCGIGRSRPHRRVGKRGYGDRFLFFAARASSRCRAFGCQCGGGSQCPVAIRVLVIVTSGKRKAQHCHYQNRQQQFSSLFHKISSSIKYVISDFKKNARAHRNKTTPQGRDRIAESRAFPKVPIQFVAKNVFRTTPCTKSAIVSRKIKYKVIIFFSVLLVNRITTKSPPASVFSFFFEKK